MRSRKGDLGKNEFTKLTPAMIKKVEVPIPIDEKGAFDISKQKELATKYEQIENIKSELAEKLTELIDIVIS